MKSKSAKSRAEELFSHARKDSDQALVEKEKVQKDKADHIANLRALRLAKEAADKESAAETAARKLAAKNK